MSMIARGEPARLVERLRSRGDAIAFTDAVRQFSRSALTQALASQAVTRILPGVYVATDQASDPLVRLRAVSVWVGPGAAVTGAAALALWDFRDEHPERVTVRIPQRRRLRAPQWVRVVRPQGDISVLQVKRVRVVEAQEAVVQAWNERVGGDGISVVIEAVRRGMHRSQIAAAAAATPRVRSRAKLAALLELLDGGVTSYLEWYARANVFTGNRFPRLLWQHRVVAAGRNRYPDAYDPEAKIALEFDGAGTHGRESARLADMERDADLASIGILTLRFTMEDLMKRPQWCIERYLQARRARIGA